MPIFSTIFSAPVDYILAVFGAPVADEEARVAAAQEMKMVYYILLLFIFCYVLLTAYSARLLPTKRSGSPPPRRLSCTCTEARPWMHLRRERERERERETQ